MKVAVSMTSLTLLGACSGNAPVVVAEAGRSTPAKPAETTQNLPGVDVTGTPTPVPTEPPVVEASGTEPIAEPEPPRDDSRTSATRVTLPASVGEHSLHGLQRFADDLADGNRDAVKEQCWTLSDDAVDALFEHRDGVLTALQGPPEENDHVVYWAVGDHNLFASPEELRSSYSCPGLDTPYTDLDAKLLAVRVAGRLDENPYRRSDTPLNYELECSAIQPEDADVIVETDVMLEDTGAHYPDLVAEAVRSVAEADTLESDSPQLAIHRVWDVARPELKLVIGIDHGTPGCVIGADRG